MKFKTLDDVLSWLTIMSDCQGVFLDAEDCQAFIDAASFLKGREVERRHIPGHGHQPLPTGRPAGPPPSGGGSGRR